MERQKPIQPLLINDESLSLPKTNAKNGNGNNGRLHGNGKVREYPLWLTSLSPDLLQGKKSIATEVLMQRVFGGAQREIFAFLKGQEPLFGEVKGSIYNRAEEEMYKRLATMYGLNGDTRKIESLIHISHKNAVEAITFLAEFIKTPTIEPDIREEGKFPPKKVSSILSYFHDRNKSVFELKENMQRQLALAYLAFQINVLTREENNLAGLLGDVDAIMSDNFFTGPAGFLRDLPVSTLHDNETNEIKGYQIGEETYGSYPPGTHVKDFTFRSRLVTIVHKGEEKTIPVLYASRIKNKRDALLKAVAKGINNGGAVHVRGEVQDFIGFRIVVLNEDKEVQQLVFAKALETLKEKGEIEERGLKLPPVVSDLPKHKVDNNRGQSQDVSFLRTRVTFEDMPYTPLEVVVQGFADYMNAEFHTGTIGEDGLPNGQAHKLFRNRRYMKVAEALLQVPRDIVHAAASQGLIEIVEELKQTARREGNTINRRVQV